MKRRKWIIALSAVFIFAFSIVLAKLLPESEPKIDKSKGNNQTAVNTLSYQAGEVNSTYNLSGRLVAAERIDLFAEVGGVAQWGSKSFKSGIQYERSEVLLQIDDRELKASLIAQKSQLKSQLASIIADIKLDYPNESTKWQNFLQSIDLKKELPSLPETNDTQFELFLAGRDVYASYYQIKEVEIRLRKYRVEAPFKGALTAAYIDEGALVRVGQALGEFISTARFELEASVDLSVLEQLQIGDTVNFHQHGKPSSVKATLDRINQKVDPATQLVKVYFTVRDARLRSGIYLEGEFVSGQYKNAMRIPAQALLSENQLFVIEKDQAKLKTVEVIEANTNDAVIRGLEEGEKLIIDPHNAAFEGSKIIEIDSQ